MLDRQPTSSAVGALALSRADLPELRLVKPFAHNLPAPLTPFIGRRNEITSLMRRLAATRLLTLTGPGGSGKTRLALEVAQAVYQAEMTKQEGDAGGDDLAVSDGIWWVELAGLAEVNLLPQTVAAVLGVREQPTRPATDSLVEALRPRAMLLILDNCEHLVTGCAALVHSLLPQCPYLRILATGQTALNMGGETVWPVPPLSLPTPTPRPSALHRSRAPRPSNPRRTSSAPRPAERRCLARVCPSIAAKQQWSGRRASRWRAANLSLSSSRPNSSYPPDGLSTL